jgi:hypothetical protein
MLELNADSIALSWFQRLGIFVAFAVREISTPYVASPRRSTGVQVVERTDGSATGLSTATSIRQPEARISIAAGGAESNTMTSSLGLLIQRQLDRQFAFATIAAGHQCPAALPRAWCAGVQRYRPDARIESADIQIQVLFYPG